MLVYVPEFAYPPEVMPYHIHGVADTLVTFTIVELYNDVNFLGTTMVGCIVYLSLTIFMSILLLSSMKLWSCFVLIALTLLMQNLSCCCSSHKTSKLSFPML